MTRICNRCRLVKPTADFYVSKKSVCIQCQRVRSKQSRQTEQGRERVRQYSKTRYQKFRNKYLARAKVKVAVLKGLVYKPTSCQECGESLPLQAHHNDYSKPLIVIWLCDICHKIQHGRIIDQELLGKQVKL